jgi:hypothetical protein
MDQAESTSAGWPRSLLVALLLVISAAVCAALVGYGLVHWLPDALLRPLGFYVLPTLSIVCFVVAYRGRRTLPTWPLYLAAVPLTAWLGVSQFAYRDEPGVLSTVGAAVFVWSATALLVLAIGAASPRGWPRRTRVLLTGLFIPVPLMAALLVLAVIIDAR